MAKTTKAGTTKKPRRDGRKAMLVYMKTDVIADLKERAAATDQKAWQFVERAVIKALKTKGT